MGLLALLKPSEAGAFVRGRHTLAVILLIIIGTQAVLPAQTSGPRTGETGDLRIPRTVAMLNIEADMKRLEAMAGTPDDRTRLALILATQRINSAVLAAQLDVQAVEAQIDYEIARVQEVQNFLSSRRDRRQSLTNAANIVMGSGVGAIGSALSIKASTATAGAVVSTAAGATAVLLSVIAARQKGGVRSLGYTPAMLAPILDPAPAERSYPPVVWAYLTTPDPAVPRARTWCEHLMSQWEDLGRLEASGSAQRARQVKSLTATGITGVPVSIDEISDRAAMLADVRSHVASMQVDLSALMRYIHKLLVEAE